MRRRRFYSIAPGGIAKRPPGAVGAQNLIRPKVGFICQRVASLHKITEVDVREPAASGFGEDGQDVEGAQRASTQPGFVEEIDRRHAVCQHVHVADADEQVVHVVAPLLRDEWVIHERLAIAVRVLGRVLRPALGLDLEGVVTVVQRQLPPAHGRRADGELHVLFVEPPGPLLAAIRSEVRRRHPQRLARPAAGTLRPKQRVAEAAPALLHALQVLVGRQRRDQLVFEAPGPVRQIAAAADRGDVTEERLHTLIFPRFPSRDNVIV